MRTIVAIQGPFILNITKNLEGPYAALKCIQVSTMCTTNALREDIVKNRNFKKDLKQDAYLLYNPTLGEYFNHLDQILSKFQVQYIKLNKKCMLQRASCCSRDKTGK